MKGNSDNYPQIIVKSSGKTQVRFGVLPVTREDINGISHLSYDFSYVDILGELVRGKIIDAIIMEVYTKDAELALINNELATPGTKEYSEYQKLRLYAKEIASSVLQTI